MIAGIDSMVLIYAGIVPAKKSTKIDKDLQTYAKILLHKLRNDTVVLPRSDTMIIAAARSAGATEFYSHDKKCRALAKLVMSAYDLPKSDPSDMFLKSDIERGEV